MGGDAAVLVAGILALDLLAYVLHQVEHRVFFFWRLHAVHHSDSSVDASTALRHHPLEFVAVGVTMMCAAAAAGAPVWLFPVFNLVSFVAALFQHMNVALPERVRARVAGCAGESGHAPRASLGQPGLLQQQLRECFFVLGPVVRELPKNSRRRGCGRAFWD